MGKRKQVIWCRRLNAPVTAMTLYCAMMGAAIAEPHFYQYAPPDNSGSATSRAYYYSSSANPAPAPAVSGGSAQNDPALTYPPIESLHAAPRGNTPPQAQSTKALTRVAETQLVSVTLPTQVSVENTARFTATEIAKAEPYGNGGHTLAALSPAAGTQVASSSDLPPLPAAMLPPVTPLPSTIAPPSAALPAPAPVTVLPPLPSPTPSPSVSPSPAAALPPLPVTPPSAPVPVTTLPPLPSPATGTAVASPPALTSPPLSPAASLPLLPPPVTSSAPKLPVVTLPALPSPSVASAPGAQKGLSEQDKQILGRLPPAEKKRTAKTSPVSIQHFHEEAAQEEVKKHESMGIKISIRRPKADTNQMLENAYQALIAGNQEAAIDIYKQVLDDQPENKLALFGLATTYHRAGQLQLARPLYGKLLAIDPHNVEGLNNFLVLLSDEEPAAALTELKKLELTHPDFSPVPAQVAVIYEKMGQYDKAAEAMNRAIALSPENLKYRYDMAIILDKQGAWGDAADFYQQLITASDRGEKIPTDPEEIQERLTFIRSNRYRGSS